MFRKATNNRETKKEERKRKQRKEREKSGEIPAEVKARGEYIGGKIFA